MTKRDVVLVAALYGAWLCVAYLINSFTTGARTPQAVFDEWVRFDGIYFRAIAEYGYAEASRLTKPDIGFPFLTAFFPLFPLLLRIVAPLFAFNYSATSVIVPQLLTGLSLIALFKLVTLDHPKPVAWFSLLSLITYPTFYFLLSTYSETLLLLLTLLTFYAYRQNKLWLTGFGGALVSATRIVGPIVFVALLLDRLRLEVGGWRLDMGRGTEGKRNVFLHPSTFILHPSTFILLFMPLGLLVYMAYLWWAFGDPLLFLQGHGSTEWKVGFDWTGPFKGLLLPIATFIRHPFMSEPFRFNLFNSAFFYGGLALLLYGWRQLPFSYSAYALLAIGFPTLTGSLISMPRFLLIAFPLFISLGLLLHHHPRLSLLLIPFALIGLYATHLFFRTVFLG